MSNQWFYIRQWNNNREKMWAVVDNFGNFIEKNINKYEAEDLKCKLEKENKNIKYFIVNKQDSKYDELISYNKIKSGSNHENN